MIEFLKFVLERISKVKSEDAACAFIAFFAIIVYNVVQWL